MEPGRGDADPLFAEFREAKIIIGPREHMLAYAASASAPPRKKVSAPPSGAPAMRCKIFIGNASLF